MNTSSIGKRIRKVREQKGWRQEDFAEKQASWKKAAEKCRAAEIILENCRAGILAKMAHFPFLLVPQLCVHPPGRQQKRQAPHIS